MEEQHKTEDRRVKRTKKALRECLFSLLEKKTADEITVKELTEAADINRSTFYFYYKDINDMIIRIQDEIYSVFEKEVLLPEIKFETEEDFVKYLTRFLVFCKEHERICRFAIGNDPGSNLSSRIKTALTERVPNSASLYTVSDPKKYLTGFAISGFWATILDWLNDGMAVSPEKMAEFMTNVYFCGGRTAKLK